MYLKYTYKWLIEQYRDKDAKRSVSSSSPDENKKIIDETKEPIKIKREDISPFDKTRQDEVAYSKAITGTVEILERI